MILRIRKYLSGKTEKNSLDPSSGGKGMRLNTAKSTFTMTIFDATNANETIVDVVGVIVATYLMINPKISAINRFDTGPANAIKNSPTFLFFRLYGLKGTGFAQPKANPPK